MGIERPTTLSTDDAAAILGSMGIDGSFLRELTRVNLIKVERGTSSGRPKEWKPEDIFNAFALKIKWEEHKKKYPTSWKTKGLGYSVLNSSLTGLKFNGYKKYTCMPEWEKVTKEAKKRGIDFGKTLYAYVPSQN